MGRARRERQPRCCGGGHEKGRSIRPAWRGAGCSGCEEVAAALGGQSGHFRQRRAHVERGRFEDVALGAVPTDFLARDMAHQSRRLGSDLRTDEGNREVHSKPTDPRRMQKCRMGGKYFRGLLGAARPAVFAAEVNGKRELAMKLLGCRQRGRAEDGAVPVYIGGGCDGERVGSVSRWRAGAEKVKRQVHRRGAWRCWDRTTQPNIGTREWSLKGKGRAAVPTTVKLRPCRARVRRSTSRQFAFHPHAIPPATPRGSGRSREPLSTMSWVRERTFVSLPSTTSIHTYE
jgi:hypothetical protein